MKRSKMKVLWLAMIIGLIMPGLIGTNVLAAELVYEQVPVQRVRVIKEVVKNADNFIVLFDASGSMQDPYKKTGMKKIDIAETMFKGRASRVPELDWNAGLYLYTPWKAFYVVVLRSGVLQNKTCGRTPGDFRYPQDLLVFKLVIQQQVGSLNEAPVPSEFTYHTLIHTFSF